MDLTGDLLPGEPGEPGKFKFMFDIVGFLVWFLLGDVGDKFTKVPYLGYVGLRVGDLPGLIGSPL